MSSTTVTIEGWENDSGIPFEVKVEFPLIGDLVAIQYKGKELRVTKENLLYVLKQVEAIMELGYKAQYREGKPWLLFST